MKLLALIAGLSLIAGHALSETWTCSVPYDEVNGGGTVIVEDDRMTFRSNWSHRGLETASCLKAGLMSECMNAHLSENRQGGASVFARLYSIAWAPEGGPREITTRQVSAIFEEDFAGFALSNAFPTLGYTFALTDCKSQ